MLLGHRRKILRAIAELGSSPVPKPPAAASAPALASSRPIDVTEVAGERRYLTVMFCDLVGSTAISAQDSDFRNAWREADNKKAQRGC